MKLLALTLKHVIDVLNVTLDDLLNINNTDGHHSIAIKMDGYDVVDVKLFNHPNCIFIDDEYKTMVTLGRSVGCIKEVYCSNCLKMDTRLEDEEEVIDFIDYHVGLFITETYFAMQRQKYE